MSHPSINKMSAADIEAAQLKFYNEFRKKTAGRIKRGKPPSKATLKKRFQKEFEPIVVVDNIHRISKKSKHFQCSISKTVEIGEISYEAANNNTVTTSSSLDVPNLVVQSASSVDNTDNSVTTYKKTVPKLIHVSRPVVSTVKNSCVETSDDKRMSEVSKNRLDKAKDTSKNDMNPPKSLLKLSKDSSNEWKLSDTSKLENTDVNVGLYSSSRKTVSCDTAKPTYTVSTASVITTSKCNTHSATLEESGNHIKLKFSLHPSTSNFPRSQNHKNSVSRTVTSTVSKTIPQQSPAMSRTLPNHNETRTVSQTIANSPINQTCVQGVSGSHLRLTKGEISALIGTGQARPQYTSNMSKGVDAVRTLSSPQPSLLQQECVDKVYFSKPPLANISSDSFTEPQMRKAKTISYEQYIQRRESQKHNSDGKRSSSNVQKSVPHADYISKYRQSIAFPGGHLKTPVTSSVSEKISYSSTISGYSPQAAPKKGILKHPQSKSHGHKPTSNHFASQNLNNQKEHGKPSHIRKTLATAVKPNFHKNVSPKIVPNSQPFIYSSNDKASVIQLSPEEMEKQRQFVKEYNLKTLSKPSVGNPQVQPNVEGLKSSHPKGSVLAKKPVIIPLNPVVPSSIKPRPINNVNEGKALKSNVDVARNESQIRSTSIQLENKSTSHSFVSKREVIICSDKSRERSCSQIANTLDVCSPNIQEHKSKLEVFNRQSSEDIPTQLSKSDSKTVSNSETGKKPIPQKSAEPKKSGDNLFEKILEKESILSESTTDNEKAEQIGENNTKTNISNDILNANKDREHRTNSSNIFENFAEIEIVSFDDSKEEESSPVTSPNVSDNVDDPKDKKASPLDSMNVSNDLDDPKDKKSSSLDSLNVFNDCDDFEDKISIKSSNVSNPLDDPKEEKSSSPDSSNLSNDFDDPNEEKSRPLDSSNMSNDFEEKSRPLDSSNVSNDFDKSKEEKSYQLDSSNISNDLDEPKEKSSPPESSNLSNDSDGFLWDDLEEIEDLSHNASVKPVFVVPDAPESDRKSKNVFSNIFGDFGRRQHSINTNLGSEFDIPSSPFHQMHEVVAKIICNPELSDDEQDFDENLLAKPPEEKNKNRDYNQIISCGQDVTNLKTNDLEHVHNKKVEMTVNDEVAADVPNKDSGQENPVLIVDAQQKHLSTPKPPINVNIVEKCTSNMFSNLSRSKDESSKIVMSDHIDDVVVTKGIASSTPIETDNRMLSRTEVSAITPIAEKRVTSTSTVTDNKQSEMCHENVHDASTTDCDTPKTKTTESSIVPGIVSECSRYGQQKDALNIEKITDYAVTETVSSSDDAKCVPFASMKCQNMPQSSGADSTSVQSLQDLKLQATVFTDNDNENVNATQTVSTDTDKVMDSAQKDYQYDMKCSKADFPIENSVKFDEKADVKLNSSDESKFIENSADTAAKSDENVSAVSSVGITYNKVTDADDTDKGTSSKDFETVDVSISEMHKEPIEQDEHVIENETAKSVESILEKLESIEAEVNDSSKVPKPNREENAVDISNSSDGNENNINHVKDNENITTSQIIANVSDETNTGVQNVVDSRCIESGEDITVIIEQQERENTSSDIILNDLSIIENDNEVAIKVQESTSDVATKSDQSEQECNMSLVTILSDQIESAVEKNNINKKSDLVVKDPESLSDSEHAIEDKVVEDSTIGNPCSELEFSFTVCGAMGSQKSHAESTSDSESNALHTSGIQNSSYEKDQNDAKSESPKVESLIIKLSAEDSESMESELAVNKEENSNEPEKHLESSSKSNEQDCPKVNIGHKLKKSIPKISIVDIGKLIGLPDRENRDKVLTKTVNISKIAAGTLQNNMGENVTLLDMHSKKSGQVEEIPMKTDTVSAGDSESKDESQKSDTCEPLGQVEKCAINSTNDTSAEKVDEMETSTELSNADTNSKSGQSHISPLNETSSSIQDNSEQDMEDNMATSALDYYDAKDDFDIQEDVLEIALADALQEEHALCSEENANSIITPDLESPSQNATQSSNAESLGAERNEVDEIKEDEIAKKFISIDTDKNEDHGSGIVTDYGSESDIFAKEQIKFYEVNKQKDDGDKNFHDLELQVQYDFKEIEECPEEKTEVRTPTDVDSLSNVLTDFFGEDGSSGESDDHSEKKVIGKECSEAVGNDKLSDDEGQTKSNAKPIDSIVEEIAPENPCKADETGQKESNGVDDSKPVDEAEDGEKVDIYESKENPLHGNALDQDSVQEQAVLTTERILLQSDNLADGTVDLGLNEKEASILETTTERCLKDIDEILENKSANSVKDQIQCTNVNTSEIVTSHIHEEPMDPSQTHEDISKSISLSASVVTAAVHDIAATKHSSENEKQLQISDVHVDSTIAQQGLENVTNKDTVSSESVNVAPSVPSSPLDDDVNEMCRIIVLENVDKALKEDDLLSICKQTPDQEKIGNDIEKTICELSCDKMECNEDLIMECEEELTLEKRNEPYSITQVAKTKENKEDKESQSIVEGQLEERESQKFNIDDLDSSNGIEDVQSQASSEIVSKIMDDLVDKSFVVVSEPSKSLQLTLKRVSKEECAVKKRKQKQITMSTGEIGSRNDPTGQMNCHTDAPTSQDSTNFEEAISSKDDCESSITTDVNDINYDNDVNNSTKKPKSYLKIPNLEARKKKYMYSPSIYDFPEETSDSLIGIAPQKFASPLKDIDEEYDNEDETDSLTRIEPERFTSPLKDIDEEHSEDGSSLPHTVEDGYMSPETISSQNLKYSDVSLSKVSDVIGENVNKTSDAKESSSMIDLNAKRSTKIGENYQIEQNLKLKECFVNLGEKPTKHKNVGEKLPIASDTTKQALSSDNSANANLNKQPRKRKKPATNNESKIKKKLVPKQAEKNLGLNVKEKKSSKSKSLKAKRLKKKLKSTQGKDKSDGEDLDSEEQVNMLIRDINDSLEKNKTNSETEHEKINQNFMSEDGESNETTNNVCDNPISSEENVITNINNTSETSNQSSEKDKIVLKIPKKMLAGTEGSSPADVKNTTSRSPHQQPIQAPDDEDDMPTILPNKRRRLKDRVHEVEEEKLMIDRINSEFPSHNWLERKIASGENVVKNPSAKSKLDVYIESHSDTNKDMDNLVMDLSNQIDQPERMEEDEILPSEVHPDATNTEKFDIADPCSTEAEAKANAKSKPNGEKQKRSVKKSCKPLTSSKGKGLAKNKLVGSSKAKGCSVRENTTVPTARVTPNNLNESGNGHPPPLRPIINIHTGEVIPSTATVPFIQISSPTFTPVITVNQPTDLSIKRPSDGITETLPAKIIKVEGTRTFPLSHMPTMGTVVQNISTQPIFIQPQNNGQTIPQVMLANSSIPVSIQTSVPQSHNLSVQSDAVGNLSMTSGLIIPTSSVPIGVQNIIPQSHTVNMHTNSTANVPIAPQPEAINIIPMTMSTCSKTPPNSSAFQSSASSTTPNRQTGQVTPIMSTHIMSPSESLHQNKDASINQVRIGAGSAELNMQNSPSTSALANETPQTSNETASLSRQAQMDAGTSPGKNSGQLSDHEKLLQQEYSKIFNKLQELNKIEEIKEKERLLLSKMKQKASLLLKMIQDQVIKCKTTGKETVTEVIDLTSRDTDSPVDYSVPTVPQTSTVDLIKPSNPPVQAQDLRIERSESTDSEASSIMMFPGISHKPPLPLHVLNPYHQRADMVIAPENQETRKLEGLRPSRAHNHQTIVKFVISTGPLEAHTKNHVNFGSITNMYCKYAQNRIPKKPMVSEPLNFSEMGKNLSINKSMPCKSENVLDSSSLSPSNVPVSKPVSSTKDSVKELDAHKAKKLQPLNIRQLKKPAKKPATVTSEDVHAKETTLFEKTHSISPKVTTAAQPIGSSNSSNSSSSSLNVHLTNISQVQPLGTSPGALPVVISPVAANISPSVSTAQVRQQPASSSNNPNVKHMLPSNQNAQQRIMPKDISTPTVVSVHPNVPASSHVNIPNTHAFIRPNISGMNTSRPQVKPNPAQIFNLSPKHTRPQLAANQMRYFAPQSQVQQQQQQPQQQQLLQQQQQQQQLLQQQQQRQLMQQQQQQQQAQHQQQFHLQQVQQQQQMQQIQLQPQNMQNMGHMPQTLAGQNMIFSRFPTAAQSYGGGMGGANTNQAVPQQNMAFGRQQMQTNIFNSNPPAYEAHIPPAQTTVATGTASNLKLSVAVPVSLPGTGTGKAQPNPAGGPPSLCDVCASKAKFVCSGCKAVSYCSGDCQHKAWPMHSLQCKK